MSKRILITGGAGFIGSHLADELLAHGYRVRALDNLAPQVHGTSGTRPAYLHPDVEVQVGDVRDADAVRRALRDIDVVFHFAAAVGVGQSMYQIAHYTATNSLGTAVLLEALTGCSPLPVGSPTAGSRQAHRRVERLIVASSMSVYGEGLYQAPDGRPVHGVTRWTGTGGRPATVDDWEARDGDGAPLRPLPTPESHPPALPSVYALSKFDQERLCLLAGKAYGIPAVALRFFNVYGPRQALSNPYTGVLAIFAARLLAGQPPLINEDGYQRRDFVHVRDVARACRLAMEAPPAGPGSAEVFNIGSGRNYSIREVASRLAVALGSSIEPEITGLYRMGDIRHCFADITRAQQLLDYHPRVSFEEGLAELACWLEGQAPPADAPAVGQAQHELAVRGLSMPQAGRSAESRGEPGLQPDGQAAAGTGPAGMPAARPPVGEGGRVERSAKADRNRPLRAGTADTSMAGAGVPWT